MLDTVNTLRARYRSALARCFASPLFASDIRDNLDGLEAYAGGRTTTSPLATVVRTEERAAAVLAQTLALVVRLETEASR